MIRLIGRTRTAEVEAEAGLSLLDLALKYNVDWGFSCTRGTCARCRCLIEEGMDLLEGTTDEEWDRLDEEELSGGYRLGCQAFVKSETGRIVARNKPYF